MTDEVEWSKRALQKHRARSQVSRVQARLQGQHIGEITIGVPVITEQQIRKLQKLQENLAVLFDDMQEIAEEIDAALSVCRGANHPEGWSSVHIVEREPNLLVADIRRHKGDLTQQTADGAAARFKRIRRQKPRSYRLLRGLR